jgi:hypothetical protein
MCDVVGLLLVAYYDPWYHMGMGILYSPIPGVSIVCWLAGVPLTIAQAPRATHTRAHRRPVVYIGRDSGNIGRDSGNIRRDSGNIVIPSTGIRPIIRREEYT